MATLRTGRPSRGVVMGVHKPDGSLTWISINTEPLRDAAQAVVGVVTSFSDITERKARDRELEAERQLNRRIIEIAPIGICIYDEHGDCVAANPAMARDIGATLPQVLAQNYHRIESWKRMGLYALATAALKVDQPLTMHGPVVTTFGKHAWLELTCLALDLGGRRGLMMLTRDLTDAKHAEQALEESETKYRSIVQQASVGIFHATPDGRYIEVNEAGCRMLGYTRDEMLTKTLVDVVDAEDLRAMPLQYERLQRGEPLHTERRLRRKDGTLVHSEISSRMLPNGELIGIVLDIAPRQATEEALRAREIAEQSNRAKSEFVSRMSHDLRTPLNAILGFSELLQVDPHHSLDTTQKEQLQHVRTASQHLLSMIDDLLDMARIEAGTIKLQVEDVDLPDVLRGVVNELAATAERAGVRLSLDVAEAAAARVRGDRTRLRQVVANLLSNAIKYNRPGGTATLRLAPSGQRLRLVVIDDGVGLTPQQQRKLFQPFNRLGREDSPIEGTGIGLVIARSLVTMMGGEMSVRSQAGRGSEFVVELPAAPVEAAAAGTPAPADALPATRTDVKGRVLYIEDDEVNRLLMTACLALRPNVELTLAVDGSSGIEAARTAAPDIILIDMSLPDTRGLDVLRALRAEPGARRVPCIAVSANAMAGDIAAAQAAGIDGYLTKPISAARLLSLLDALL